MTSNVSERRMSVRLAGVIDEALDLAEQCGWRYALAYLISEKVPSPIIQRLLFGGGQVRQPSHIRYDDSPSWNGSKSDEMKTLFDWLRQRRTKDGCTRSEAPCASRSSMRYAEID